MCIYKGDYVKIWLRIGSSPSEWGPSSSVSAKYLMSWGPSHSSHQRPVGTDQPNAERGRAAPLLSTRSLSTKGAMKLTLPLPGAGGTLCVVIPSATCQQAREPRVCVSFAPILPFGSRKGSLRCHQEIFLVSRAILPELVRASCSILWSQTNGSCWLQGPLDVFCKIKFFWRNSSITPEDLVGQVLQEWSKNTVKI